MYSDYNFFENPIIDLFNNNFFKSYPEFFSRDKKYDFVNRGTIGIENIYNYQRNIYFNILEKLKNQTDLKIINGGFVSRSKYIYELSQSRFTFSPFGWGELCYRDFEAIQCGSILIKTNMDGIETFPNIFIDGQNYISTSYDLDDFQYEIMNLTNDYKNLKIIAENAKLDFMKYFLDSNIFIDHFRTII